ncbi:MAG: hypothetical protein R3E84_16930 [Pseudomonadales bacterium]
MKIHCRRFIAPLALLLSLTTIASTFADGTASCDAQQGMTFVCGPRNPEDLVALPDTPWVIVSGMSGEGFSGHLYLLDPGTGAYQDLFPGSAPARQWDQALYGSCPGLLDLDNFSAHGLAIRPLGDGLHQLYVTSHGAREAVELFTVDARGDTPGVTWVGCVPMPKYASINSVAPLPDGGFITTRIFGEGPEASGDVFAGEISGYLYEWHPGGSVTALAGTDLSGPNGIETSRDGNTLFVASWGSSGVHRYVRRADGSFLHNGVAPTKFRVDNVRWSDDGRLLAAGHRLSAAQDCGEQLCLDEWEVAEIDTQSLTARTLAVKKPVSGFTGATVAVRAGGALWLGTFHGDRLARLPD